MPTPYPKYDTVVAEYTRRIARGDLAEGDRIPSLQGIAREFGISLTTADRVVVILKDRKLVRGRAGAARYVRAKAQERARRRLAEDAAEGEGDEDDEALLASGGYLGLPSRWVSPAAGR